MRTDSLYLIGELRTAQVVSIIAFVVALMIVIYRRVMVKNAARYKDA
jgi:phosphatidylglycerol:prolipoprotein diacylglycerol transferase